MTKKQKELQYRYGLLYGKASVAEKKCGRGGKTSAEYLALITPIRAARNLAWKRIQALNGIWLDPKFAYAPHRGIHLPGYAGYSSSHPRS